jgi:flagellar motor switch protein FliG
VASLGAVSAEEQEGALEAFRQELDQRARVDGPDRAERLMAAVLGRRPDQVDDPSRQAALQRLRGLSSLEPATIRRMLQGETPQMVAVVLGQLNARKAAGVVQTWPREERAELALRVARLGKLAPGVVEAIGEVLGGHACRDDSDGSSDLGVSFVVSLLEDMDRASSRSLLEELRGRDTELAAEVEDRLFTFESIRDLSDASLQTLLRAVDNTVLARALKGVDSAITERLMANLSSRGQEMLQQEMELLGPVLVREVEAAQREVVHKAMDLEEAGEISLVTEEEAYVE